MQLSYEEIMARADEEYGVAKALYAGWDISYYQRSNRSRSSACCAHWWRR